MVKICGDVIYLEQDSEIIHTALGMKDIPFKTMGSESLFDNTKLIEVVRLEVIKQFWT